MDRKSSQTRGDGDSPVPRALTRAVTDAFFDVYNELRFGFLEAVYCAALATELADRGIAFRREPLIEVIYKGRVVGKYRPDFLVEECLALEVKSTRALGEADARQILNCLKATKYEIGYLLHFGPAEARYVRVISSLAHRQKHLAKTCE